MYVLILRTLRMLNYLECGLGSKKIKIKSVRLIFHPRVFSLKSRWWFVFAGTHISARALHSFDACKIIRSTANIGQKPEYTHTSVRACSISDCRVCVEMFSNIHILKFPWKGRERIQCPECRVYTDVGRATEKGWKTVNGRGQERVKILNAYFKMSTVLVKGGSEDRRMCGN